MTPSPSPERARIVAAARAWIGTPYQHQASCRRVGADCLGLLRGVYAEVTGAPLPDPPPYSRDWAEALNRETLLEAAQVHLRPREIAARRPGDVLAFRFRHALPAKHVGILTAPDRFLHAIETAPACEVVLCSWWARRIAGVFAFPGVPD